MPIRQEQRAGLSVIQVVNGHVQFHPVGAPGCAIIIWLFLAWSIGLTPWAMHNPLTGTIVWLGPVAMLIGISWVWRRSFQHTQKLRDKRANLVVKGRSDFPYVVYLRSFSQPTDADWARELDSIITRVFEPKEILITLESGHDQEPIRPGNQVFEDGVRVGYLGAGRIQVENEDWEKVVIRLLQGASLILMIPASGTGILFETEWIMTHGLSNKMIFIMPPSPMMEIICNREAGQQEWSKTTETFSRVGIELPNYSLTGMLFSVGRKGRISHLVDLEFDVDMALRAQWEQAKALRKKVDSIRNDLVQVEKRRVALMLKYQNSELVEKLMERSFFEGQTGEQLIDSLGSPEEVDVKNLKTKKKEIWKYNHKAGNRYGLRITLDNDVVVKIDQKR